MQCHDLPEKWLISSCVIPLVNRFLAVSGTSLISNSVENKSPAVLVEVVNCDQKND